ncbi:MAG: hypothetical protein KIT14_09105 [bacterium]|nr:hypothetical protein [bacterium]
MNRIAVIATMACALAVASVAPARAKVIGAQKGLACNAVWNVSDDATVAPGNKFTTVTCVDGTPCDKDGSTNGSCTIEVSACSLSTAIDGCTPDASLTKLNFPKGNAKKFPGLSAPSTTEASCGTTGTAILTLAKKGKKPSPKGKGTLKMVVKAPGGNGKNLIKVQCLPCTDPSGDCSGVQAACFDVCPEREAPGLPQELNMLVPPTGSDLDNGYSGESHNFPVVNGSSLNFCLSECDGTSDTTCRSCGKVGAGTKNGPTFGAPLPLLSNNVPVCVVNEFRRDRIDGTYDTTTGAATANVNLNSRVFVLQPDSQVCPRCSGNGTIGSTGTCQSGRSQGQPCTVNGLTSVVGSRGDQNYQLSSDCLPSGQPAGVLVIDLPLTTGESRKEGSKPCPGQTIDDSCSGSCTVDCSSTPAPKGGINQTCCSNNPILPCFPTAPDSAGFIVRTGNPVPVAPAFPDTTSPKTSEGAVLAAVFCEARTTDATVDNLTGLPGPGAILLPVIQTMTLSQ